MACKAQPRFGRRLLAITQLVLLAALGVTHTALADDLDDRELGLLELFNYYEYSPNLASSGQPRREQFTAIAHSGIEMVINLAPVSAPDALADEGEIVTQLGLAYVHIPVDWEAPTVADVQQFLAAMDQADGKPVLVHCYANARASAFVYLYRVLRAGHADQQAHATLTEIWDLNPGYELASVPHWQALLAEAQTVLK